MRPRRRVRLVARGVPPLVQRRATREVSRSKVRRALVDDRRRAWRDIKAALAEQSMDAIVASLRPPATPEALRKVGVRSLRYAYAIHDGQALAFDEARRRQDRAAMRDSQQSVFHGLFGGVSAYDYVVCTRFVSIAEACEATDDEEEDRGELRFAANYDGGWRFVAERLGGTIRERSRSRPCSPTTARGSRWRRPRRTTPSRSGSPRTPRASACAPTASRRSCPTRPTGPAASCSSPTRTPATTGSRVRGHYERHSRAGVGGLPAELAVGLRLFHPHPTRVRRRTRKRPAPDETLAHQRRRAHVDRERRGRRGQVPRAHINRLARRLAGREHDARLFDRGPPGRGERRRVRLPVLLGHDARARRRQFPGELEFVPGEVSAPTGEPLRVVCPEFALRKPRFLY